LENKKTVKKEVKTSKKQAKNVKNTKKVKKTNVKSPKKEPVNVVGMRGLNKIEKVLVKETITFMNELEIYQPQYRRLIEMYASLLFLYDKMYTEFEESGYKVVGRETNKAGFTNERKTGLYLSIEKLREEIFRTQNLIGLTPLALKKLKDDGIENQTSTLRGILKGV